MDKIVYPLCIWELFAFKNPKIFSFEFFFYICFKMGYPKKQMLCMLLMGLQQQPSSKKG